MKNFRFFAVILTVLLLFNLCGCDMFNADTNELLSPPQLTGELAPIAEALSQTAEAGYTLKYPSGGNYHSAVTQNDINSDGTFEAFALYSTLDGDTTYMHINVIVNRSGKWVSVADQKVVAGGVEIIDFCDLNADGVLEVIIGYEVYGTTEKQLAVYTFDGQTLLQRMYLRYTHFLATDLNADDKNELFVVDYNPTENTNTASLHALTEEGSSQLSSCSLDTSIEAVNPLSYSTLSDGTPAVYIDEVKGAGAITEVVFMEKGQLVNPLLSSNTGQNVLTLRASMIESLDINDDGITEIPIQSVLPSVFYKNHEVLYYTDWYSFNGNILTKQLCTIMNFNDGYYLEVPTSLAGKLSVLKDTERKLRIFYRYNPETETIGAELARIQVFELKRWDSDGFDKNGLSELARSDSEVFAYKISEENEKDALILAEQLKTSFKLMEQEERQ